MDLEVTDLTVRFGSTTVVDRVSFAVRAGERLGMIGESGSGKTLTALSVLGLVPDHAAVSGSIRWSGRELLGVGDRQMAGLRGKEIGIVFQDPTTSLNPIRTVGAQVAEPLRIHYSLTKQDVHRRVLRALEQVHLPDPAEIAGRYPHQLSGGQRQRVAIASAIITSPRLLIADEPTTALDVTVQAGILELFNELTDSLGASLIFVTHDIALLGQVVSRAQVMAAGRVIETGSLDDLLHRPAHPVTAALVRAARATSWEEDERD